MDYDAIQDIIYIFGDVEYPRQYITERRVVRCSKNNDDEIFFGRWIPQKNNDDERFFDRVGAAKK